MSKRKLPQAEITARPGLRTEIMPSALNRWNPEVHAAAKDDDNSISILDVIGQDFWGEGVTSKRISAALRSIGKKDVVVNVNSPGGDYFEGLAIYNMLRDHPGKVTVKVLGIAASAASVIAMAGDEIQIARAGFLMIHNTWVVAVGDRHQLRDVAEWLEPFDQAAVDIYSARTGLEAKDIAKMLDRETWIGGAEAVEKGFADSLLSSDEIATKMERDAGRQVAALHKFDTLLARAGVSRSERRELLRALKGGTPSAAPTGMQDAAVIKEVEDLLAQIRSI
jgi:Protease subunit of ATP-dependent Clp proteases